MKGNGSSLFRAVVVAGAALCACGKSESAALPASVQPPVPTPPVPTPLAPTPLVVSVSPPAPVVPSAPVPLSVVPSGAVQKSNARSGAAGVSAPKRVAGKPCPPGSEMPFPPCYYIL